MISRLGFDRYRAAYGGAFLLLLALIAAVGFGLSRHLYEMAHERELENLATVSATKANELERWIADKTAYLAQPPSGAIALGFERWRRQGGRDASLDAGRLRKRLDYLRDLSPEHRAVWLMDLEGLAWLGSGGAPLHPRLSYPGAIEAALGSRRPALVDFHMDPDRDGAAAWGLEMVVPLFVDSPDGGERAVGLLLYQIDPEPYLFPLFNRWPTASRTAESLLFRVRDREIEYLTRLRHPVAESERRRSVDDPTLLAAQAVRGGEMLVHGVDYRGVAAVGIVTRMPVLDWHVLCKIDEDEISTEARRLALAVALAVVALLLGMLLLGWLVFRQLRGRDEAARLAAELARLRAADALRVSEARYQAIVDSQSWEMCRWQPDTTLTFVNYAYAAGRGIASEKLIGRRWIEFVPAAERAGVEAAVAAMVAARTGKSYEHPVDKPEGGHGWMAWTDTPIFNHEGVIVEFQSIGIDISARKETELALQVSEQRLSLALEAANEGLWDWDLPSGRAYLAPTYYTMLGYQPGDFPATFEGWTSLLHPDDLPALMGELSAMVSEAQDRFELEFRLRGRDGQWHWVLGHGMAIARDADHLPVRIIGINLDIGARRAAEAALRESEARFRTIFDNIHEAILIHDQDTGAVLSVNRRACELYGMTEAELRQARVEDISSGDIPYTQAEAALWMMKASLGEPQNFEWHARDKAGRLFWVEVTMRRARIGDSERLLAVVRDVTRRRAQEEELRQNLERQVQLNKRLEEAQNQLLQSEKMASIGQLAAGVAHELNNPIGFVHSNLGTLDNYVRDLFDVLAVYGELEQTAPDCCAAGIARVREIKAAKDFDYLKDDIFQLMAESKDGLVRVRKIVQDLKDFSRVGEAEWQWADLHKGLDSTLNIVWNELKYKCKVTKEYGELPEVYCLPSQLNQVFMNLLVNAAQAIEVQGTIAIRSGRVGQEVWVEIADSGKGIAKEHLTRIFDPFFTTKPVGKGTGLGLSLSYSIVQKHRGRLEVVSEVGKGTTFRLTLPIEPDIADTAETDHG